MNGYPDKKELYARGKERVLDFCRINGIYAPTFRDHDCADWPFQPCAYYRDNVINICLDKCAKIGTAGRQWSYPGYTVDRTPYGVVAHELGHHIDVLRGRAKGAYYSDYSVAVRADSGEYPLTTYCPNNAEWFAEMIRLFVTNPDLLRRIRPATYRQLTRSDNPHPGLIPITIDSVGPAHWRTVLREAPARTIAAAEKKLVIAEHMAKKKEAVK